MKRIAVLLAMGLFAILLAGCRSPPAQQYVPVPDLSSPVSPGMARIFVFNWPGVPVTIRQNGAEVGTFSYPPFPGFPYLFLCWERIPGPVAIQAEFGSAWYAKPANRSLRVNAREGSACYIDVGFDQKTTTGLLEAGDEEKFTQRREKCLLPQYVPGVVTQHETEGPASETPEGSVPMVEPTTSSEGGL